MEIPDFSKYPHFDAFMRKKDKYILDENNNPIPADLMEWGLWLEENKKRRIVKKDTIESWRVSTVFIGLDHKWSLPEEKADPNYKPHIFETMIFTDYGKGHDIYCARYATWKEAEEGHQLAIDWVNAGCAADEDEIEDHDNE